MPNGFRLSSVVGGGAVGLKHNNPTAEYEITLPNKSGNMQLVGDSLTLGTAVTASGTSIDFTGIPSWAKRITVMFNGISTNGSALLQIQIGAGSVTTTGYVSSWVGGTTGNVLGGSSLTSGFGLGNVGGAVNVYTGSFDIETIGSNTWIEKGIIILEAAGNAYMSSGRLTLGGTLDRIRITTVNGTDTFDAGSISLMYEG